MPKIQKTGEYLTFLFDNVLKMAPLANDHNKRLLLNYYKRIQVKNNLFVLRIRGL